MIEVVFSALKATPFSGSSWFLSFKALVSNKKLTHDDIEPVLEKMEMVLISRCYLRFIYSLAINLIAVGKRFLMYKCWENACNVMIVTNETLFP